MTTLLIISDDLTGALDSGAPFAKSGVRVAITTLEQVKKREPEPGVSVLAVDAETRHLPAGRAYAVTRALVEKAVEAGIPHIYIKTDSGLRGNIGSELQAALDTGFTDFIPFVPAFPDMNRITRNGIHYVDGKPLHRSVFGRDPFEPVSSPDVRDLFRGLNVSLAVFPAAGTYDTGFGRPTVGIFDAETNDGLRTVARHLLRRGQLRISAGCAGFAAILQEFLELPRNPAPVPALQSPLLVVCGSLNPVSEAQIRYAHSRGFARTELTPEQLLTDGYFGSEDGRRFLAELRTRLSDPRPMTVDTGVSGRQAMDRYLEAHGVARDLARVKIARNVGVLIRRLLEPGRGPSRTLMVIGGDTLLGFIGQIDWREISPVCELDPGTVLFRVEQENGGLLLISKSGGFGGPDLLERLSRKIGNPREEESPCPFR